MKKNTVTVIVTDGLKNVVMPMCDLFIGDTTAKIVFSWKRKDGVELPLRSHMVDIALLRHSPNGPAEYLIHQPIFLKSQDMPE